MAMQWSRRDCLRWAAAGGLAAWALPGLAADKWPARPIRLVVPFPPGGSSDILARMLAERLAKRLDGNFVVENKAGGTTQIGTEIAALAPPDGYTLLNGVASSFTILPNLRKLNYALASFEPLGGVADYVAVLAVRNDLPAKTARELVAHAKAHPGKLTFGSAGEASAGHIMGATLAHETGIEVLHVPFKGSADAANALVAGQIDFVIDGAVTPMAKAQRVRPLATFYRTRHPGLPEVPTTREAGLNLTTPKAAWFGLFAPKGMPREIVQALSRQLGEIVAEKDFAEALGRANCVAAWQAAADYKAALEADTATYAALLPVIGVS